MHAPEPGRTSAAPIAFAENPQAAEPGTQEQMQPCPLGRGGGAEAGTASNLAPVHSWRKTHQSVPSEGVGWSSVRIKSCTRGASEAPPPAPPSISYGCGQRGILTRAPPATPREQTCLLATEVHVSRPSPEPPQSARVAPAGGPPESQPPRHGDRDQGGCPAYR